MNKWQTYGYYNAAVKFDGLLGEIDRQIKSQRMVAHYQIKEIVRRKNFDFNSLRLKIIRAVTNGQSTTISTISL